MDEAERERLARRLSAMKLSDVRKEIRALDRDAVLKYYRNAIWDEYHTLWLLPNAGVSITLVEKIRTKDGHREVGGGPRGWKAKDVEYVYLEARVEPLVRPPYKRGATGPVAVMSASVTRPGSSSN
ncbi:MAG: hypothetical protein ACUVSU_13255 [Aggregatilineaceae bacterium]